MVVYRAVRHAGGQTRLYFGNLRYSVNEEQLGKLLASRGIDPTSIQVFRDPSGRSLGYGFVNVPDKDELRAINSLNGCNFMGRPLRVESTRPRAVNSGTLRYRGQGNPRVRRQHGH